ncbi:WD40 repeat protein [Ceratobasidium sp. AG-Ba]|nr:WD40 repeat protein [Ceratobasidium sp. AG-Ba]
MQAEIPVSPPRLLTRRTQPAPSNKGSRLHKLLGLQPPPEVRSNLHDTMFVVPRSSVDPVYERAMAPTPDPGCSGTMGMGMSRGLLPRLLEMITTPKSRKGKSRVVYEYADGELLPLDGEEGELIDDEACFLEVGDSGGIDILSLLPPELALHIFLELDYQSVVACLGVSHAWRRLAADDTVWRALFYRQSGWTVNVPRRRAQLLPPPARSALLSSLTAARRPSSSSSSSGPSSLNWPDLFRQRHSIANKWKVGKARPSKLAGHLDSVYCLELDTASDTIVTGSRDRTIKVWSVRTGELKETLAAHEGSVLCLKVELRPDGTGFMCSGSSDRTVRVWERSPATGWVVKAVLTGHAGGVLDLRIDDRWIVSCSKDTLIRVWDRHTLELHCVLRGHDGPVNAVGLQAGQVVSASGDGTMILWDIETGNRVRTFTGHDKGLACVEFKGDTIISGSNDRKIKVWSASTGECILTLPGHELLVRALAYDAASGRLVSASYDRTIKVWDLSDAREGGSKLVREFKNLHDSHIFDVKFDATKIVSTSHDQKILVLDFAYDVDGLLFI